MSEKEITILEWMRTAAPEEATPSDAEEAFQSLLHVQAHGGLKFVTVRRAEDGSFEAEWLTRTADDWTLVLMQRAVGELAGVLGQYE